MTDRHPEKSGKWILLAIAAFAAALIFWPTDWPEGKRYKRIRASDCETVSCLEEAQVQRNRERMVEEMHEDD